MAAAETAPAAPAEGESAAAASESTGEKVGGMWGSCRAPARGQAGAGARMGSKSLCLCTHLHTRPTSTTHDPRQHKLQNTWAFFYNNPKANPMLSWEEKLQKVYSFDTVEDFWA